MSSYTVIFVTIATVHLDVNEAFRKIIIMGDM